MIDTAAPSVLATDRLNVAIRPGRSPIHLLSDVDVSVGRGEIVGLVGESGSGKTMFARAVTGLLAPNLRAEASGSAVVAGTEVVGASIAARRRLLQHDVSYIFQDPMSHLNPTMRIGKQIDEAIQGDEDVSSLLRAVGLPGSNEFAKRFPHTLSGGMRQRVLIACALAKQPQLLIADEPTTALDVTVQAQVLELLARLATERDLGVLLITHDLAVVAENCTRIYVMYAGQVVEQRRTADLLASPLHPYSRGLLDAVYDIGDPGKEVRGIAGAVPNMNELPPGCRFSPRCRHRTDRCDVQPPARPVGDDMTRCWFDPPRWSEGARDAD